jgi:excisionase family DNA binding protein
MENLLNVNQVAFILKVHPLTVRRYINEKKLPAVKAGGNVRIRESDIGAFTREFSVKHKHAVGPLEKVSNPAKPFTADDPLLRMEGRGASLISR